ncbi:MAG TPA: hypothetical protein VFQ71_10255 [Gaiellales bacterium]|nr:hypothetical protein [Gaiellales bacterium]
MIGIRARIAAAGAVALLLASAGTASAAVVQKTPTPTWQTNGRVLSIQIVGSVAYIGGKFTSVRPAGDPAGTGEVSRNHAAAIDLSTQSLLPWDPNTSGTVQAVAVSGSTVYLGGSFGTVGGKSHKDIAAVDATTGAPIASFKAKTNGEVLTIQATSGNVYAGGNFTTMDGTTVGYLAAVDATTGALNSGWTGSADAEVLASTLTPDGSRLVVGGDFTHVDGASQNHISSLSPATGATQSWTTHTPYAVVALSSDSTGVFVAGAGNGGNFAGFSQTGSMLWQGGTNGNVQAVTVMDGVVYVGGHYTEYCGPQGGQHTCTNPIARSKLLAVDEATGTLNSIWHPAANSTLGVFALDGAGGRLALGGDFTKLAGVAQQGFGEFVE